MQPIPLILCAGIAAFSSAPTVFADDADKAEIAELKRQVEALTKAVADLKQQVTRQQAEPVPGVLPAPSDLSLPGAPSPGTKAPARASAGKGLVPSAPEPPPPAAPAAEGTPAETNLAAFNPQVSVALDGIASYSRRSDNINFLMRSAEVQLAANVDQLARAYLVINAEREFDPVTESSGLGKTSGEVEEAAIETTALPYGLTVKFGEFYTDFTRLDKVHSHDLPFTDRPMTLERTIGGETQGGGVELTWVPKTSHYFRLSAGAVDGIGPERPITRRLEMLGEADEEGTDAFRDSGRRSFSDVTYYGRLATIFELGPQTMLNVGASYAHGRDGGDRTLAGADFKLSWTPSPDRFDLFELGGEYLYGRSSGAFSNDAVFPSGPTSGSARAWGAYAYAQYRFGQKWQPGVRFEYYAPEHWAQFDADGDGAADGVERLSERIRSYSAYLNYHLSEFSRLRLTLNYLDADEPIFAGSNSDWQLYLQWSITLGPHKHPFTP